ncbi:MAG: hypothetical protein EU544_05610 [Promethearchaeota archaeon]|nr:MAG: hypothetical protein EU544_05610 [Candidatus Lokiarchaeota archaeon]
MFNKIKMELLNLGLKFMNVDEKIVRMILETKTSNVNEIVIMPAVKLVMKKIVKSLQNKRVYGRVYNGKLNNVNVSVIRSLIGCPHTAMTVECLKRCSTKVILRVDVCGGINTASTPIDVGDIVVPNLAYTGDGTSPHYLLKYPDHLEELKRIKNPCGNSQNVYAGSEDIYIANPDSTLNTLIRQKGKQNFGDQVKARDLWTTDAMFCETEDFINALKSIEIGAVDMESSILFLLGAIYNIKTTSILSVSDLPGDSKYDMFKTNEIHPNLETGVNDAIKLALECLPEIASEFSL